MRDPDVVAKLMGTGAFAAVDLFDATLGTPSLQLLQGYQSALVYYDSRFKDGNTLGDVLAAYFEGGGQVVICALKKKELGNLGGAFIAKEYSLFTSAGSTAPMDSLGAINEPQSPLVQGVKNLTARFAIQDTAKLANGAVVVADWASGNPLIVRGVVNGRKRVDLNFFPPSNDVVVTSWVGDGAILMKNALLYR